MNCMPRVVSVDQILARSTRPADLELREAAPLGT